MGWTVTWTWTHPVRARRDKRTAERRESKPRGTQAPQTWGVAEPSARFGARRSPAPSLPASGRERLAQSPAGPAPRGSAVGHRGARAPARKQQGAREKKEQPPHRSGRTRGSWSLPRFPQLQTAGNGNDATRSAFPTSTVTRKSGSEATGTPFPRHCPPRPPAPSDWSLLHQLPTQQEGLAESLGRALASIEGTLDGFPSNGYLEARPAPPRPAPKVGLTWDCSGACSRGLWSKLTPSAASTLQARRKRGAFDSYHCAFAYI